MQAATKVMMNTGILYAQILVTMFITLFSVPLVLKALGASDYGLYSLVAGVIAMLAFLNAAMTVSTQRFMSVTMGEGNIERLNTVYNTSIILHFIIGLVVIALLEVCGVLIFNRLNIDSARIDAAKIVYQFLVGSLFLTIIGVPFDASMNAYEDMLTFSVIRIMTSVLKLGLAVSLPFVRLDRLVFYALGIAMITLFGLLAKAIIVTIKYKDLRIAIFDKFNVEEFKNMFGFAGWNTFGAIAMVARNQGIAVILNLFFGTVLNASYGIANQINATLSNFSATLQKSINPQLMKSQGSNNQDRMLRIAFVSSKFSVLILGFVAVPLIVEMPYVLKMWLKNVPDNTVDFARLILGISIIYQFSSGIKSAIQSGGKIRGYTVAMGGLLLVNLPIAFLLLRLGLPAYSVLVGIMCVEGVSLIVRIVFAKKLVGINERHFVRSIIVPMMIVISISLLSGWLVTTLCQPSFIRFIITSLTCVSVFLLCAWAIVFSVSEKSIIHGMFITILHALREGKGFRILNRGKVRSGTLDHTRQG